MQALEWMRRHLLATGAIAGLVVGTVVGMARPIKASAPDPAALASWTEYGEGVVRRFDPAGYEKIRSARLWSPSGAAMPGAAVQWRLAGIIVDPVPTALVYGSDKGKALRLNVGDALPDGGRIEEITARSIRFTRDGCPFERVLYSVGDQAGTAGCGPQ